MNINQRGSADVLEHAKAMPRGERLIFGGTDWHGKRIAFVFSESFAGRPAARPQWAYGHIDAGADDAFSPC
jgi:hypothetical protein